jgi:hypothetical protein
MKKRNFIAFLLLASLLSVFAFAGSVSAIPWNVTLINPLPYGQQGQGNNYTINVSTNSVSANITNVTITVPLNYTNNVNGTLWSYNSSNVSLVNITGITSSNVSVSWSNSSVGGIISANGTSSLLFWFNVTVLSAGPFNVTLTSMDNNGIINSTNLTIQVNDTVAPTASFVSPTPVDTGTIHNNYIPVNISFSDFGSGIKNATIHVNFNNGNGITQDVVSPQSSSGPFTGSFFYNFTSSFGDGVYYLSATVFDNAGNNLTFGNFSDHNYTIVINTSAASGSGSGSCTANWNVVWGPCLNGSQTQIWTDLASCGDATPSSTSRTCVDNSTSSCTTVWNCTLTWTPSVCTNGTQTRICTDVNGCAAPKTESRDCVLGSSLTTNTTNSQTATGTSSQSLSYAFYAIGGLVIAGVIAVVIILMRLKRKSFSGGDFGRPKPLVGGAFKPASPSYPAGHL